MLQIVLCRDAVAGKFRQVAKFKGEIAGKGKAPFLNACRKLIEMGHAETERVQCRWEGSTVVSFEGQLGEFAKWTVSENENTGPRITRWKPFEKKEALEGL